MNGIVFSRLSARPLRRSDQFLIIYASSDDIQTQLCCGRNSANVIQGRRRLSGKLVSVPFSLFLLAEFLL
jgi:hypothetical protein